MSIDVEPLEFDNVSFRLLHFIFAYRINFNQSRHGTEKLIEERKKGIEQNEKKNKQKRQP